MKTILFIMSLLVAIPMCFAKASHKHHVCKYKHPKHAHKPKKISCGDIGIQKIKFFEFRAHKNPKAQLPVEEYTPMPKFRSHVCHAHIKA